MSQWKYNNVELEIDMEDVGFQERYENAFNIMEEEEKKIKKDGKVSEITKAYCNLFWNLFDNIFGSGTADKLFEGKVNSRLCDECYDSFLSFCKAQVVQVGKKRAQRLSKYNVNTTRK